MLEAKDNVSIFGGLFTLSIDVMQRKTSLVRSLLRKEICIAMKAGVQLKDGGKIYLPLFEGADQYFDTVNLHTHLSGCTIEGISENITFKLKIRTSFCMQDEKYVSAPVIFITCSVQGPVQAKAFFGLDLPGMVMTQREDGCDIEYILDNDPEAVQTEENTFIDRICAYQGSMDEEMWLSDDKGNMNITWCCFDGREYKDSMNETCHLGYTAYYANLDDVAMWAKLMSGEVEEVSEKIDIKYFYETISLDYGILLSAAVHAMGGNTNFWRRENGQMVYELMKDKENTFYSRILFDLPAYVEICPGICKNALIYGAYFTREGDDIGGRGSCVGGGEALGIHRAAEGNANYILLAGVYFQKTHDEEVLWRCIRSIGRMADYIISTKHVFVGAWDEIIAEVKFAMAISAAAKLFDELEIEYKKEEYDDFVAYIYRNVKQRMTEGRRQRSNGWVCLHIAALSAIADMANIEFLEEEIVRKGILEAKSAEYVPCEIEGICILGLHMLKDVAGIKRGKNLIGLCSQYSRIRDTYCRHKICAPGAVTELIGTVGQLRGKAPNISKIRIVEDNG